MARGLSSELAAHSQKVEQCSFSLKEATPWNQIAESSAWNPARSNTRVVLKLLTKNSAAAINTWRAAGGLLSPQLYFSYVSVFFATFPESAQNPKCAGTKTARAANRRWRVAG